MQQKIFVTDDEMTKYHRLCFLHDRYKTIFNYALLELGMERLDILNLYKECFKQLQQYNKELILKYNKMPGTWSIISMDIETNIMILQKEEVENDN